MRSSRASLGLCAALLLLSPLRALAGGARWYTGPPFYRAPEDVPVVFFTPDVLYYTDSGDLAANVNHEQADAIVAAAAAVWNVPTARLTLAQGGTLAEHVSGGNVNFDGTQVVWPDDVQLANYRAKPIAVVYDTDGSVIDTLLGSGASGPAACRQNAVVESVDGLDPDGTIHHALLILNGRCVGANADQLTQMKYQLTRAFGRVIGLAWSQLNDNVFTGTPTPTLAQALNWPLMHPIDVICGPYTFKCMAQPFTLRPDDLCALALLYPVTAANVVPGKAVTTEDELSVDGRLRFPTGQGMDAVNVVVTRQPAGNAVEPAEIVSAVSGMGFQQFAGNPVTGAASGAAESNGTAFSEAENSFVMRRIPLPGGINYSLYYKAESINPLYTGAYAIGPYVGTPAAMSGPEFAFVDAFELGGRHVIQDETLQQSATSCNPGSDGTENAPAAADASGFWSGLLCGPRHTSWWSQSVQAGRTWTVEVTAVDENGVVSTSKAHPLLGMWNATDARGTLPTVALTPDAFNAQALGMTQLKMDAASAPATLRIAVADDRGHGRPDFGYKMRVLYADSVVPAQLGPSGGTITITGEGFRSGNRVTVNGVAATVVSWTANSIVATAPTRSAAHMAATGSADVAVLDASTGGSTVMQAALSYSGATTNTIALVSSPVQVNTNAASATPLVVRVTGADGVTAVAGASVRLSVSAGSATFAACGAAACVLTTDANGFAQSVFTASANGVLALSATETSGGANVQASVTVVDPVRLLLLVSAPSQVQTGAASATPFAVRVTGADGVTPVAGASVRFAVVSGSATFAACGAAACTLTTDSGGYVQSMFTASVEGTLVLSATELGRGGTVQASVTVLDAPRLIALVSAPAQLETGFASATAFAIRVTAADGVTAVAGASVRLAVTAGSGLLSACGTAVCTVTTDSSGYAASAVIASAAGPLTLTATELKNGADVQATVAVSDPVRSVTVAGAARYLAAGAAAQWTVSLAAAQDGTAAVGAAVMWSAGTGLYLGAVSSTTDAAGGATVRVLTPGLAAGAQVAVQGCAWTTVCASSVAFGVGAAEWALEVAAGAGQSVAAPEALSAVTLRVTDAAGHALEGASVTVYQTVTAWEGVCAGRGRCAAAPVLASSHATATSDAAGNVIVTPLEVPGVASVVHITAVTGTQGFTSLELTKTP